MFTALTIKVQSLKSQAMLAALSGLFALLAAGGARAAVPDKMTFYGAAAHEITSSLNSGDGWCVVSAHEKVKLVDEADPIDCVKYRVVMRHTAGRTKTPEGDMMEFVTVELGPETPWISVESGVPVNSGPSVKAAKIASAAVATIDGALPELEKAVQAEPNPDLRALGVRLVTAFKKQRAALVDLIQKDVDSVASNMK